MCVKTIKKYISSSKNLWSNFFLSRFFPSTAFQRKMPASQSEKAKISRFKILPVKKITALDVELARPPIRFHPRQATLDIPASRQPDLMLVKRNLRPPPFRSRMNNTQFDLKINTLLLLKEVVDAWATEMSWKMNRTSHKSNPTKAFSKEFLFIFVSRFLLFSSSTKKKQKISLPRFVVNLWLFLHRLTCTVHVDCVMKNLYKLLI